MGSPFYESISSNSGIFWTMASLSWHAIHGASMCIFSSLAGLTNFAVISNRKQENLGTNSKLEFGFYWYIFLARYSTYIYILIFKRKKNSRIFWFFAGFLFKQGSVILKCNILTIWSNYIFSTMRGNFISERNNFFWGFSFLGISFRHHIWGRNILKW